MSALDDMRQGSQAAATPYVYAYDHPMIVIYPTPGAGSTLEVKVAQEGPTLADSASAITFWPAGLLYGVLTNYALARAMQYRRQPSWTDYEEAFLKDTNKGLPALKRWVARTGGRQPVQSRDRGTIITSPSQDMWSL